MEEEFPNLLFAKDGEVYDLEASKARVEKELDELGWKVDAVLTHTCPYWYTPREAFLRGVDQSTVDSSTERWLDSIAERLETPDANSPLRH